MTTGVQVFLNDVTDNLLAVTIPGGAYDHGVGWKVNGTGQTWSYRNNQAAPPGFIRRVTVNDRSAVSPGLVTVLVRGARATYPVTPASLPLSAAVVLDPGSTADLAQCTEARFASAPVPGCVLTGAGTVRCR